jgi:methionyl-tRNA formyltransferase
MKVAILSAFPRIDRHAYKTYFLEQLLDRPWLRPEDVLLVYGNARLQDYRRELARLGAGEVLRRLPGLLSQRRRTTGQPTAERAGASSVAGLARRRGVRVAVFGTLASRGCLDLLREFTPDAIHNLSGAYVPRPLLALGTGPAGVVGGHYGLLPDLRGTDTVRWSIHLDVPLAVSHMALVPELDMGDILSVRPVAVQRGDTFARIYRKCQFASADGHLDVLDAVRAGTLVRTPQRQEDGSLFQRMGPFLRGKVDAKLARGDYAHYE